MTQLKGSEVDFAEMIMSASSPADILEIASKLFRMKNSDANYGNNFLEFGKIMAILYPSGYKIKTETDWNFFGVLFNVVSKLCRLRNAVNSELTGGVDFEKSIDNGVDMTVYSAMLTKIIQLNEKERDNAATGTCDDNEQAGNVS